MDKANLRYWYGQYRMAYKRNLNQIESLDYFRDEIIGMFGETFYNHLVEMYDSVAWITEYHQQRRRIWDIYQNSDIGRFNLNEIIFPMREINCNCEHFFGCKCPIHDNNFYVIDDMPLYKIAHFAY